MSVPIFSPFLIYLPRIDRQLLFKRSETDGCAAMSFVYLGGQGNPVPERRKRKENRDILTLTFFLFLSEIFVPSCHSNYIISSYSYNF
jgi:hypothetical protein